jgi:pyruvate formate lyase activating enzyme
VDWVLENLGPDVPLHFTAFHPDFKLRDRDGTPPATLHEARAIALEAGLHYVYEGNIHSDGGNTSCPSCKTLLIRRSWHDVRKNSLKNGCCPKCGLAIPGRWENSGTHAAGEIPRKMEVGVEGRYSHLNL